VTLESPVLDRLRATVKTLMQKHGITQSSIAKRIPIPTSSMSGFLSGKHGIDVRHLDRLGESLGVTASELVARKDGLRIFELTDQEARLMTHVRKWPPAVRDELLSVLDFLMGFVPDDEPTRQVMDHWNRMDAGEKRHFLHLAVYLRDTGLPRDVRVGLGLPLATPGKSSKGGGSGGQRGGTRQKT
jgi:transcriptional regulator with XRE-family HTH domain